MTIEQLVLERGIAIAWIVLTWMTWQFGKGAMDATAPRRRAESPSIGEAIRGLL